MKITADKVAVTDQYLTIGCQVDYGGALRFTAIKVPITLLVESQLTGVLERAEKRRLDEIHERWIQDQDALFD